MDDHEFDYAGWVNDAREGGFPAVITGLVLLCGVLDWPFWSAVLALGLMVIVVLLITASAAFPVSEPDDPAW